MIENEFLAAEERPISVFERGPKFLGFGGFERELEFEFFLGGWRTGKCAEENFIDQVRRGLF